MSVLAKQFNISDNSLRKKCIKHNIPLPENGHWQRVRYGKKTNKIPLQSVEKKEKIILSLLPIVSEENIIAFFKSIFMMNDEEKNSFKLKILRAGEVLEVMIWTIRKSIIPLKSMLN
ncbi:hypothetical protein LVD15_23985 [Fulvivirga maritima]|uniref:hypothetical protein n=1 Tax=Fulvivirga maritima TaxID=2904247 RepID=UPI001F205D1C|nr:hypothetical protein [Fulvivirga maritima]UII26320.1 hypothetical protein LVD15_23985 [Fulvivirga maritima]